MLNFSAKAVFKHPKRQPFGLQFFFIFNVFVLLLAACSAKQFSFSTPSPVTAPSTLTTSGTLIPDTGSQNNCTKPAASTASLTEGPYFKTGSPERTDLTEPGMPGAKLVLTGTVLSTDCVPIAHALLDFWQADSQGQYDNSGYTLRGHQYTDSNGKYQLTTIIPGLYPGRTEHIHVKVQAPDGPVLTTQLFFPHVAQNDSDGIFDPSLVLNIQTSTDGQTASFDFIVPTH